MSSLGFALRHAAEHGLQRIIYVIPYTSIIEQNAQVFKEILGKKNVLENHCNVTYEDKESGKELKMEQLAAENWDKPVVVTTNVRFLNLSMPAEARNAVNCIILPTASSYLMRRKCFR